MYFLSTFCKTEIYDISDLSGLHIRIYISVFAIIELLCLFVAVVASLCGFFSVTLTMI